MNKLDLKPKIIFIMGPTASGKTALSIALRKRLPVEIISVDSTLVYRFMNIGTAKPTLEEQKLAPHYLLDILDPSEFYSVAKFRNDALIEIDKIISTGRIPLLVGGTMLYFKALLCGLSSLPPADTKIRAKIAAEAKKLGWGAIHKRLQAIDPVSAAKINTNDSQRLSRALEIFLISGKNLTKLTEIQIIDRKLHYNYNILQFVIIPENKSIIQERIKIRFLQMLKDGFENEVMNLYLRGDLHEFLPAIRSVGYRQMWSYLSGIISYDEMIYRSICATNQLAKRQMTWLKGWKNVYGLEMNDINGAINKILHICRV